MFFKIEDWKFVSIPDPDWALVIWCGSNPVLKYNGAFVVSRQRSLAGIPQVKTEQTNLIEAAQSEKLLHA